MNESMELQKGLKSQPLVKYDKDVHDSVQIEQPVAQLSAHQLHKHRGIRN